ncbi:MAG: hypothetical protein WHS44_12960 [Fimbriimonadales bacterium]
MSKRAPRGTGGTPVQDEPTRGTSVPADDATQSSVASASSPTNNNPPAAPAPHADKQQPATRSVGVPPTKQTPTYPHEIDGIGVIHPTPQED